MVTTAGTSIFLPLPPREGIEGRETLSVRSHGSMPPYGVAPSPCPSREGRGELFRFAEQG